MRQLVNCRITIYIVCLPFPIWKAPTDRSAQVHCAEVPADISSLNFLEYLKLISEIWSEVTETRRLTPLTKLPQLWDYRSRNCLTKQTKLPTSTPKSKSWLSASAIYPMIRQTLCLHFSKHSHKQKQTVSRSSPPFLIF